MAIWRSLQVEDRVDTLTEARRGGHSPFESGNLTEARRGGHSPFESGNLAEAAFVIDRLKGINDIPVLSAVVPILQDNFPEVTGALYVVPANATIRTVFAVLAPLLNAQVRLWH